ncbi:Ethanolamine kinase 2 [Hypsibius exemplaris]|uniref:ethanolamine kinase n=1 Tax=Hypsibius exemplaris TaxID=2072580 RepID=A0A1W0W8K1_HYPEX|nr:Ethanolamine kinase 2 [Hypsibius exemplaris]
MGPSPEENEAVNSLSHGSASTASLPVSTSRPAAASPSNRVASPSSYSSPNLTMMHFNDTLPMLAHQFDVENAEKSTNVLLNHFRPELRQQLKDEKLIIKKFTGGVTNKLLAAYFPSDKRKKTLIRVYGAETDKFIDRAAEIKTLLMLNENQCSGKLYGVFENGMCYEFVPGETLTLDDVRDEHISRLIIRNFVKLHCVYRTSGGGERQVFNPFKKMSSFLELVPKAFEDEEKQRKFMEYYPNPEIFAQEIEILKEHLTGFDIQSPKVFCHNDLLCANILYDKEKDCVNFIDFEYAGLNHQAYDLANHFNEFAGVEECDYSRFPSREYQISWLTYYLKCWNKVHNGDSDGGADDDVEVTDQQVESLYVVVNKFTLVSHLLWILWTLIQAEHSEIDFDFLRYGKLRFDEYNRRKHELLAMTVPSP